MKEQGRKRLLVIAGATVTRGIDGRYVTKNPISEYLNQLSEYFDVCTWVANRYQGNDYTGVIDELKVRVVVVERGWRARIRSWFEMRKLVWDHNYVLYYLPNPYLPILPLIKARARRLVVYLAGDYELGIQWYASQRWLGWSTLFRWSFEFPMRYADAVIARGRRLARMAARFNSNVHETVPLGHMNFDATDAADSSNFTSKGEDHRILYVGKIVETKGVGDLLESFQTLIFRHPQKRFLLDLVGDGEKMAEYESVVREWGVDHLVTFHGWISSEQQINRLFRQADVLVVPSIYPEGVPRVIDEAIVRGVPVVATPVGGIGEEFCNDEIKLVKEKMPAELSDAIEQILFDEEVRTYHLQQALKRKELFRKNGSPALQHKNILLGDN